ncbi:MAG TPA: hypothetical protein VGQ10_17020 [Vicinamibacterales bacterium]|jgi:hypothetical protein|nr:hypothetical protein [Vicinamibacterales bacterium]
MKHIVASIIALLIVVAGVWAQSGQADQFNGTWKLNVAKSTTKWQAHPQPKVAEPQPQSFELITMSIANDTLDYKVEYARANERHRKANYTARYNDARWQDIHGDPDGPLSTLTLVKTNDRTHYWVTRGKDGQFAGLVVRQMAEDGKSFTSVGLGGDGYVQYVRVFDKQ